MGAVSLQAEALDHRRLGIESRESRIGAAAFCDVIDHERLAKLGVNLLRLLGERARRGGGLEGRGAALKILLDFCLGQKLVLDRVLAFFFDGMSFGYAS